MTGSGQSPYPWTEIRTYVPAVSGKSDEAKVPNADSNPACIEESTGRAQKMVYAKGKSVCELVDPDGHVYVLQAREERFPMASLPELGEQLEFLPRGWLYRTRTLTEDLILDLGPDETIYAVWDEFHQYYTRIPKTL